MKCGGGDGGEGASSTALICTFGISISDSGLEKVEPQPSLRWFYSSAEEPLVFFLKEPLTRPLWFQVVTATHASGSHASSQVTHGGCRALPALH